jgi:hypothetical protein
MLFIVSKSGSTPDLLEIQEGVQNMVEEMQESNRVSVDHYDEIMKGHNIDWKAYAEKQKKLAKKNISAKKIKTIDWRVDKPMNPALQEHLLRKKLKKELGDAADHYDPKTMIDSDLHYDERLKALGFDSGKRDDEAYYEDKAIEYEIERTGKDRETIGDPYMTLEEQAIKDKEPALQAEADRLGISVELYKKRLAEPGDRIKHADIITLARYSYQDFREASQEGDTSIRVSNVSHLSTVKSLVSQMATHQYIQQVNYARYLLLMQGVFDFKRRMELRYLYDTSRDYGLPPAMETLQEIDEEIMDAFANERVIIKHRLSFEALKRGGEEWMFEYPKGVKYLIKGVSNQFHILESDLVIYCIISGIDSYYKKCQPVITSPHAHYYVGGELILDADRCIQALHDSYTGHWLDIISALKLEYRRDRAILRLNPGRKGNKGNKIDPYVTPDLVRRKVRIIAAVEKHLEPMDFMTTAHKQAKQETLEGWFGKLVLGQIDDAIKQTSQPTDKSQSHAEQLGYTEKTTAKEVVREPSTEFENLIKNGVLTLEDLRSDIQLQEWLKNQCPICGYGDIIEKDCIFCGWEFEEMMQPSSEYLIKIGVLGSLDDLITNGLLSNEDICSDIKQEKELIRVTNSCPICCFGDVIVGVCVTCGWEFEENALGQQEA